METLELDSQFDHACGRRDIGRAIVRVNRLSARSIRNTLALRSQSVRVFSDLPRVVTLSTANGGIQQAATQGGVLVEEYGAILAILVTEETADAAIVRRVDCLDILSGGRVIDGHRSDSPAVRKPLAKLILCEASSVGCCCRRSIDKLCSRRDVGNDGRQGRCSSTRGRKALDDCNAVGDDSAGGADSLDAGCSRSSRRDCSRGSVGLDEDDHLYIACSYGLKTWTL